MFEAGVEFAACSIAAAVRISSLVEAKFGVKIGKHGALVGFDSSLIQAVDFRAAFVFFERGSCSTGGGSYYFET